MLNMKPMLPPPDHISYKKHRKQVWTQILAPMLVVFVVLAGLVYIMVNVTVFQGEGDVSRWAAISMMWISLPVMIIGILSLVILAGIIYFISLLLQVLPVHSVRVQNIVYKVRTFVIRAADLVVRPVIFINSMFANVRAVFGKPPERKPPAMLGGYARKRAAK